MDFDQNNEKHLKVLEDYIKRFHQYNGIADWQSELLGKIASYWHRRNVKPKSKKKVNAFRIGLKHLIEDFRLDMSINNYEILDVLYDEIEDIILFEEDQKKKDDCIKYYLYVKDGQLTVKVSFLR